jgi:CelD/BcsL family acetyltransferase involved in cellulose biosynthesis
MSSNSVSTSSWTIDPIDALARHEEAWRSIGSAAGDTPLLDFRFVTEAVRHFASGEEKIARLEHAGKPRAIALIARVNALSWQTLQPANAPIGFVVAEPGIALEPLLGSLALAVGLQCGMVSLTQQDPAYHPRPADSPRLTTLDYILTPSIDVKGSFADFMAGRSKNFRHNISRQRNRLKRETIATRLEILTAASDMARAIADYSGLECASWKGAIDSAVKMDEPQGRFYVGLLESFATIGEAAVCRYFFNEHLVASDLCLVRDGTLIILKTAYDETSQGYSPAHLMRIEAFAEFIDRRAVQRVEFYGPLTEWHARLTDDSRRMYHVNYYRWRGLKFVHALRRGNVAGEAASKMPEPEAAEVEGNLRA